MEEKYMVSDILENSKNNIKDFVDVINTCNNMEFRQMIQSLRNREESFEYELLKIATSKGYINLELKANVEEIDKIRKEFL